MKKILSIAIAIFFSFSSLVVAEMRVGLAGSLTHIEAEGSETEGGEKTTASADNTVVVPSIFFQYDMGNYAFGLDYIPLEADISSKAKKRTDTETSVTGTAKETTTTRNQSAQANINNHITLYANYKFTDNWYAKIGYVHVNVEADESLGTGSKYGDADINGGQFGIGTTDGNHSFELLYTDYENVSLTSSVARTGVTTNNKVEADLDTLSLRYSYAF